MQIIKNVMKKGVLKISKIEAYKEKWINEFTVLGTKDKKIYFQEPVTPYITEGLRFKLGDETLAIDRWSRTATSYNATSIKGDASVIAAELVEDNRAWLTKCLCNNTKTKEYAKIYGGYSKGCYELELKIL